MYNQSKLILILLAIFAASSSTAQSSSAESEDEELPMQMFKYSISYLGYLFAALLIDHYFLFQLSF